ncbi:MAG TPA: VanW family protein [Rubrobacteraceae bacterium]|nr:VanW family protein [Rubrobacteraceae bacterium]
MRRGIFVMAALAAACALLASAGAMRPAEAQTQVLNQPVVLGEYATNYLWDSDPGRRINLAVASQAIDGTILAPGAVFSFNDSVAGQSFAPAKVIIEGKVDYAEGGGLCQVSSTLYMAANYAGLKILERSPHSAELPYIQPGFDATVWLGLKDMKFKNTTGSYVIIREWMSSDGNVYAQIYGQPTGKQVAMGSYKSDSGTDKNGDGFTVWKTYKTVTRNGKVLFDGLLHTDTYHELKH